ncbi:E3 ubiquitin ligase SCF complex, Skp subunit [Fistulina hepatica ATCC 64428]|uniref:E3 ubiquitin ligase complex SCF subunit n=1 Tax=Fistulina hepatica ATCC 64428 TaxID=1128425 RepID=A0A0D7A1Q1_9AGAR|nr:E3 ubiquitin ligase SCF complex, Skp subunit [Fistulina hepatica ATCC 64428]
MRLVLETNDSMKFETDTDVMNRSRLIGNMVADLGDQNESFTLNVTCRTLHKVMEYLVQHRHDPLPEYNDDATPEQIRERRRADVSYWDRKYVESMETDQELFFDVMKAADYLDIQPLLDLTIATVANRIRNMNPEGIRQYYNIPNDFTPKEQAEVDEEAVSAALISI